MQLSDCDSRRESVSVSAEFMVGLTDSLTEFEMMDLVIADESLATRSFWCDVSIRS